MEHTDEFVDSSMSDRETVAIEHLPSHLQLRSDSTSDIIKTPK